MDPAADLHGSSPLDSTEASSACLLSFIERSLTAMLLEKLAQYFERLEDQAPATYVKSTTRSWIELESEGRFEASVATEGGMKRKTHRGKRFLAPQLGRSPGSRP